MRAPHDRTGSSTAERTGFRYSAKQREKILRALPPGLRINSEVLMAKLTRAAEIAIDPERKKLERHSANQLRKLLKSIQALDPSGGALLAHATGVSVSNLTDRIKSLIKNPPLRLAPHNLGERRHNFVMNVCFAWSEETTRWPLRSVKDTSPLLKLADAALPEGLLRHGAHGQPLSLRKTMNAVFRELHWDHLMPRKKPRR